MSEFIVRPIGYVRSERDVVADDGWDAIPTRIELDPQVVEPESTLGLDAFSHIEVVFLFDRVSEADVCRGARHPRGREDWPLMGILAHRAKDRPNRLGLTVCRLVAVDGLKIAVSGLDAIEGTPVLDIKPWIAGFGPRGATREPDWARELMSEYW
jgi:tRNA (Thr-GGU) A37 N-methylase